MKKSSMKTAPKGRMPPTRMLGMGCKYHGCGGMLRGMLLMRTGCLTSSALKPKYDPSVTSGTEMPNHSANRISIVVNCGGRGSAAEGARQGGIRGARYAAHSALLRARARARAAGARTGMARDERLAQTKRLRTKATE